jgi:hypothetical protein
MLSLCSPVNQKLNEVNPMSNIDEALKNLEMALAELKATLQAEQMIDSESVTNQEQLTDEQLLEITNIRF